MRNSMGRAEIDVTQTLAAAGDGETEAASALLPVLYDELKSLAERHLRLERADHTLQPTALVHEAYLRLIDQRRVAWKGRDHFVAVASTVMRRILVNHAKARQAEKRGGALARVDLDAEKTPAMSTEINLVALDEALSRLRTFDCVQSRIVELRYFGGLTVDETARVLDLSARTVHREWQLAKAWLRGEIKKGDTQT